ncbi:disulfide bond formation protein B [Halorubrum sp. Atlit-8R]|uniref:Disulfide bond formation protein B n=1 Tax=Halorubrum salinarum TaxID=2739057 RepID=A0A7D4BTQ6_9EURY|nr:disulfide bond formation protein B [Halorubrum salinarum]RLM76719.1 disulfide bond formation protein B [Halorubrum sp. Atlit-8R]TKX85155.1 disulfide bond formation protein B [Halorubrum sp. SS5]
MRIGKSISVAEIATIGIFWFSLGLGLRPCVLGWYQRILMNPLVIVLGVTAIRSHLSVWWTNIHLSVPSRVFSTYHPMVQAATTSCSYKSPCAAVR